MQNRPNVYKQRETKPAKRNAQKKAEPKPSSKDADTEFEKRDTLRQPVIGSVPRTRTEMPPNMAGVDTDKVEALEDSDLEEVAGVEGEGSYTAGRRYDAGAARYARSGDVERSAAEAKRAVDEDGEALAEAEREGKRGPRTPEL